MDQVQSSDQEWLTVNEVLEKYDVSRTTVQRWASDKKVVAKKVDRILYISRPSIDSYLEKQKEAKKARDLAFAEARRAVASGMVSIIDQGEVLRLKKQVQELSYENSRLNGEVGVYEKELNRMYTIIQNLLVPQR